MKISEAARAANVNVETIRFYERRVPELSRFAARSGLLIGFAGTQRNRNQHGVKVVWSWRVFSHPCF